MPSLAHLLHPPPLPDSFLFGVATSDHQSEAFDERFPPDVWDVWERRDGVVPRGRATDFWNRWEEDVLNAHQLGCRAFRFSIAWTRVEPRPGEFDREALEHYRAIVVRLRQLGMEPIVTLCHFVWPKHVEDRGGLRADRFADWFAAYAAQVRAALDPHVRYWITFNEPNILLQGFYKLWFQPDFLFPPGHRLDMPLHRQIDATLAVIRHLFEAHAAARQALRAAGGTHNLVSANVFQLGLPALVQRLIDKNVMRLRRLDDWREQFWRVVERPTLFGGRVDLIIAPATHFKTRGFDAVYVATGLVALVKRDAAAQTLADLDGQRIGLVRGPGWEQVAAVQAQLERSRIDFFDRHDQALTLLDADRVAAVVTEESVLRALVRQCPGYRIIDERLTHHSYVIAVEAGHPALIEAAQHAVRALHSEANQADMCSHYFPLRAGPLPAESFETLPPEPPASGLGRIQERGKVVIGVPRTDVPWLDVLKSTPDRGGFEFDLGRALAGVIFGDAGSVEFRRVTLPNRSSLGLRIRDRIDDALRAYTVFSTFVSSSWWYLGMRGQLPPALCPPACVGQLDFVALDYYFGASAPTPRQLRQLTRSIQRQFNRSALWAGGLREALHYYHTAFPHLPILIAENGFADEPNGQRRGEQLAAHVRAVQRAVAEGIDVRAYCVWSITSNREWGLPHGAGSDFGLYYVDMDGDADLKRHATPSVEVYRQLIAQRGAK